MICLFQKNNSCGLQGMNKMQGNLRYTYTGRVFPQSCGRKTNSTRNRFEQIKSITQVFSELCLFIHHREAIVEKTQCWIMGNEARKKWQEVAQWCSLWQMQFMLMFLIFLFYPELEQSAFSERLFFQKESLECDFFRFRSKPLGINVYTTCHQL